MSLNKALTYGGTGAAAGSMLGPWGTAIGGAAGGLYGLLSGDDPDPAEMARNAAAGVTAPTIDPNAGIGTGWGGATPAEQAAALEKYRQSNPGMVKYMEDTKKAADAARASGNTAEADRLDAAYQKQQSIMSGAATKLYGPDMSDPARFAAQAQESYNRQAPQVEMVRPDMANYSADRSMFTQGGTDMGAQLSAMQSNPIATGQGQQELVNRLNSDLSGTAPSLAEAQLAQTTDQNLAAQRSMVATAGPMDYGAAQRAAIMGGANTQQQAIQQAAILRAQEYAQARGELGTVLGQQRGQTLENFNAQNQLLTSKRAQELQAMGLDADSALKQANLEAQQRLNNANLQAGQNQLNQNREMGYLGAYQDTRHMQQGNTQFNATNDLEAQRIKAGLQGGAVQAQTQQNQQNQQMQGTLLNAAAGAATQYSMMQNKTRSADTKDYTGISGS